MTRKTLSFVLLVYSFSLTAQHVEGEIELNGFILGQYRKAVHAQLGAPIQRIDTKDGWIYEFNLIRPDTSVYALFKYPHWDTLRIHSIQVNGYRYSEMHPFKSLKLGAHRTDVDHVLGKFHDTDTVKDPPVVVQYYHNKNYSVEIDDHGRLYGIQVFGSILANRPQENVASIDRFVNAILTKNTDSLLLHLMPDVELYINNKSISYSGAAREEFKKEHSEMKNLLLGSSNSVWHAFHVEKAVATPEVRIFADKKVTTTVYKFHDSKTISEIVFMPHAGRWKVYEINFRKM